MNTYLSLPEVRLPSCRYSPRPLSVFGFQWEDKSVPNYVLCVYSPSIGTVYSLLCIHQTDQTNSQILAVQRLKAILYLDVGIVSGKGEQQAINTSAEATADLNAGFIINTVKYMDINTGFGVAWFSYRLR